MEHIFFLIIYACSVGAVVFSRQISVPQIGALCLLAYTYPLALGYVVDPTTHNSVPIKPQVYLAFAVVMIVCSTVNVLCRFTNANDAVSKRLRGDAATDGLFSALLFVSALLYVFNLYVVLPNLISGNSGKAEISSLTTGGYSIIFTVISVTTFAYFAYIRSYLGIIFAISLIFSFTVIFQSRSAIAYIFIVSIFIYFIGKSVRPKEFLIIFALGLFAYLFLNVFDQIKGSLIRLDVDRVIEKFWSESFYWRIINASEPQRIMFVVNAAFGNDIAYSVTDYLRDLSSALPFSETLFGSSTGWGPLVVEKIFPDATHNYGQSVWGQVHTVGGIAGVAMLSLVWGGWMWGLQRIILSAPVLIIRIAAISVVPVSVFILNRVSIGAVVNYVTIVIALAVVLSGLRLVVRSGAYPRRKSRAIHL